MIGNRLYTFLRAFVLFDYESNDTMGYQFERHAARKPQHPFVLYRDRNYSYGEANAQINRYAHGYKDMGIKKNDVVALIIENRPELYWHFFALLKIGAIASLINTHLRGEMLVHAVCVCNPKALICGSERIGAFQEIREDLSGIALNHKYIDIDPEFPVETDFPVWHRNIGNVSTANPPETATHTLLENCAFIYTSGTTGMPKPAIISHHRFVRAARIWGAFGFRLSPSDVTYICLPLYHSNAIILATGAAVNFGTTIALSRKFSVHHFWEEIRQFKATTFVYIGELCRYLINQAPSPKDRSHSIHTMTGNGLGPGIWKAFKHRFGIRYIREFYAATESNAVSMNTINRPGSVGFKFPHMKLVKWNDNEQTFARNADGRMVKCNVNEPGILLARVPAKNVKRWLNLNPGYDGYLNKNQSDTKILRDVFKAGDAWFNTGDMLRCDFWGYLYFVDRLGDTFRWKGENVSTYEVQEEIAKWVTAKEVNVYGVAVDGTEGRAGMTSIVLDEDQAFDPDSFKSYVDLRLPEYARPLFVRLSRQLETTSTYKLKKKVLREQGFDPGLTDDPLYFREPLSDRYIRLTPEIYRQLKGRKYRL